VTTHGLALNVDIDLGWFERIVPCGLPGRGVTSIAALTDQRPDVEDVGAALAAQFGVVFQREMFPGDGGAAVNALPLP
jgi:lipoyl(octanoyl) transferase